MYFIDRRKVTERQKSVNPRGAKFLTLPENIATTGDRALLIYTSALRSEKAREVDSCYES